MYTLKLSQPSAWMVSDLLGEGHGQCLSPQKKQKKKQNKKKLILLSKTPFPASLTLKNACKGIK